MLESMSAPPEYAAAMAAVGPRRSFDVVRNYRHLAGFGAMLIDESSPRNRIVLDAQGRPQIEYELTDVDRRRLAFAVEEAVRVMLRAGAREVFLPSFEDVYGHDTAGVPRSSFTDAAQLARLAGRLKFVPNRTLVTSAHLQASDRMGTRPEGSVVSTRHRVWGVDGLFVADASTFPSSVGANPMESVYVFAKLFADELLTGEPRPSPGSTPGGRP
jgi:choline dehydrogenase-like flavoprotein